MLGLKLLKKSVFSSILWQCCQFYLQKNASSYVLNKIMQVDVHKDIKTSFNMPSQVETTMLLKEIYGYCIGIDGMDD